MIASVSYTTVDSLALCPLRNGAAGGLLDILAARYLITYVVTW